MTVEALSGLFGWWSKPFEVVLVYTGCMEAVMYLHSFAKEFLVGKSTLSSIFSTELDTDLLT
jgi:hypothetical protein